MKGLIITAAIVASLTGFGVAVHYDRQVQTCHRETEFALSGRFANYDKCEGRWGLTNEERFVSYVDGER